MRITKQEYEDRKSQVKALFFMEKMKQREIANIMQVSIRTVEDYVYKIKKDGT